MGYKKMKKNLGFADFALASRPLHNLRKATGRLSFYPKIPLKISLK
jgi:hypothetical protein